MWLMVLQVFIYPQHLYCSYLLTMMTHVIGVNKLWVKIRSLAVLYNAKEQYYFIGGVIGATTLVQNKMEVSDSKSTSKPSFNKVRIVRVGGVYFCAAFLGGVPVNKMCVLIQLDNGSCNKYKTHAGQEKGYV